MPQRHPLTITVNDQLTIDAGYWQACVEEDQTPYRRVSPPQTAMYRQALSYLEEATKDMKAPAKSQLHFGEVAIATVAVCLRWIDLMQADQQRFRKLVKAAVQLLPFPIAQLDESTYDNRFRALGAIYSANGRRSLMEPLRATSGRSGWNGRRRALSSILRARWPMGSSTSTGATARASRTSTPEALLPHGH
jgi:hypothetical protein